MLRGFLAALCILVSPAALTQGLQIKSLEAMEGPASAALGEGYIARAEPQRLTLACPTCEGAPAVDIRLGRQTDGTEDRVRSGQTTIEQLQAQCQAREPSCTITKANVGSAVGWLSSFTLGSNAGSTLILLKQGDMLTIRSIASNRAIARRTIERLSADVVPAIVGR